VHFEPTAHADVTTEEKQACQPGKNADLDRLVAQLLPSAQPAEALPADGSPKHDASGSSAAVLRAVQELLPLLSSSDLQQVSRTVQKLL